MEILFLKIIIFLVEFLYLYNALKDFNFNPVKQNFLKKNKYNSRHCKHLYEYSKIEKKPTEEEDGNRTYICKYCRNQYYEIIPKLNKKNYKIENLTSNCKNGNGIKYYSELFIIKTSK